MPRKGLTPVETDKRVMERFLPPNPNPAHAVIPMDGGFGKGGRVSVGKKENALEKCSNSSAPGHNQIGNGVWK